MKRYLLIGTMACLLAACGNNDKTEDSKDSAEDRNEETFDNRKQEKDAEFAVTAANDGMAEVALGRLAQTKGSTAEVRNFAASMVTDHSAANNELKSLAMLKNITLPDTMSNDMQDTYNDLAKKTGMDFDKAYIDLMVKDHKNAIDLFEKESEKGYDPEIKSWAAGKLPTLRHHLMMAEEAQKAVKDKK